MTEEEANTKIAEFNRNHYRSTDLLFVKKLKDRGLSSVDIACVIETLESVCTECFDGERPCSCWNDE